jgi:putative inorganic carbon (HCO3(-)) transporter
VAILLAGSFVKAKAWKMDFLRTMGPYRVPILLLLAASCFAVAFSPDPFGALGIWKAFFVEPILLFFVFRFTFTEREDFVRGLWILGAVTAGIAAFALVQSATGLAIPPPWDVEVRATSIFDFPNAVGLFVAPIVAALVVIAVAYKGSAQRPTPTARTRVILAVIAAFGLLACFLSQTEAVYIAIPAALFIVLFASRASTKTKLSIILPCIILAAIAFGVSSTVREKLSLQDTSGQVRLSQWRETSDLLKDHPLVGAGLNGYPIVFEKYHDPRLYEIFQYPHNILLNFWVELGILGVIALIVFILSVGKVVVLRRDDVLVLAGAAALLTMCIHGVVDVPFFKNDLAILTVFFLAMTLVRPPAAKSQS